jgi:hypothetical protein
VGDRGDLAHPTMMSLLHSSTDKRKPDKQTIPRSKGVRALGSRDRLSGYYTIGFRWRRIQLSEGFLGRRTPSISWVLDYRRTSIRGTNKSTDNLPA